MQAQIARQVEETPAMRADRLLAEARAAAAEQVARLERSMGDAVALSAEIARGGDIYPAGVRELCRRLAEEADMRGRTLHALSDRLLAVR
jgi:hypothetical protein